MVNDLERPVGTYLYGRRMYETMVFWESPPELTAQPPFVQDFAGMAEGPQDRLLQDAADGDSAKTLIEREFDPEAIRQLKAKAGTDLSIGGAALEVQPAFGCYLDDGHAPIARPFGFLVLTLDGEQISAITFFSDTSIFARFGLPRTLPRLHRLRPQTGAP